MPITDGGLPVGNTSLYSYEDYVASQKIRTPNQDLGKDDFLNLLVAQMQYQDPLEPTKDTEFVAQLAQFNTLQQINALNDTMSMFQSYSLTGKYVYGVKTLDSGLKMEVAGFVKAIINKDGVAWAQVGDTLIKCSEITEVIDGATAMGENPLLSSVNLIGKYVEGKVAVQVPDLNSDGTQKKDDSGNLMYKTEEKVIKGVVTRVAVTEEDGMVAYLDNDEKIPLSNIHDVRDKAPDEVIETAPVDTDPETDDMVVEADIEPETETTPENTGEVDGSGEQEPA